MAEEFKTGICGSNLWNSPSNGLNGGSLPCSISLNDIRNFGWPAETVEMKARSCQDSVSVCSSSTLFQDPHQKPQGSDSVSGGGSTLMDSNLQMMDLSLSYPSMDWNQALVRSGGRDDQDNFQSMFQEDLSSRPNYRLETGMESSNVQKVWSPKNFFGGCGDSSLNALKQINQGFPLDQHRLITSGNSSGECTMTCQGLPTSFSMNSISYGCPSTLSQGMFEPEFQPHQSPYENRMMSYSSQLNYMNSTNELSPSWPKFPQSLNSISSPKQQHTNQLHFSNNAPFWNASEASNNDARPNFFPSPQTQLFTPAFEEKSQCSSNFTAKPKMEESRDSVSVVKNGSSEPSMKRPRIETPSPSPAFKVRKEKLGDRITALQQLVSPFGKTDTASVLLETIEYIRLLHEQVSVLSAPYMKNGVPIQHQLQNSDKLKDTERNQQDLRSRGLCLVPISSTFPIANEMSADYWTPPLGRTFR